MFTSFVWKRNKTHKQQLIPSPNSQTLKSQTSKKQPNPPRIHQSPPSLTCLSSPPPVSSPLLGFVLPKPRRQRGRGLSLGPRRAEVQLRELLSRAITLASENQISLDRFWIRLLRSLLVSSTSLLAKSRDEKGQIFAWIPQDLAPTWATRSKLCADKGPNTFNATSGPNKENFHLRFISESVWFHFSGRPKSMAQCLPFLLALEASARHTNTGSLWSTNLLLKKMDIQMMTRETLGYASSIQRIG